MSIDILLIYPKLGSMDRMIMDLPLSIIYAAAHSVKRNFNVKAVDLRCLDENWKKVLSSFFGQGVLLAGVSVMTGTPLYYAREISLFIKKNYPDTKIVWGGPHVTLLPETIQEDFIDFLIRGYGSIPLAELIKCLKSDKSNYSAIKGLSYKSYGKVFHNERSPEHEMLHYLEIPYYLIDVKSPQYTRSYMNKQMFPIFTSIGCPYQCSFCVHPTIYKELNAPKWRPYPEKDVVDHIEYIIKKYDATHICFMDDTSFANLKRMKKIFDMIINRGINVTLEFRGARVNEIDRMDDDFISLMIKAGGRVMLVGVESGSDRILNIMQKGITREQIIRVNQKLAKFPDIIPHYNFIYGSPGEKYNDLIETKTVVLQLLKDNPKAYFGFGGDWKPIPGSKMLDLAEKEYNFKTPKTLNEWIQMDSSDAKKKIVHSWYTRKHNNMIKLMQISSFVIDDKIIKESFSNKTIGFRIIRFISRIYKPIAIFRLKFNIHHLLIEYNIWKLTLNLISHIGSSKNKS